MSPRRTPSIGVLPEVRLLLMADKIQNRVDFERSHAHSHPRAAALVWYFNTWLAFLRIDDAEFHRLRDAMMARRS